MFIGRAVSWRSNKQILIATSSIEVKFVCCFKATSHGVWLRSFMFGLRIIDSVSRPLRMFCDNSAVVSCLKTTKVVVGVNTLTSSI